MQPPRPLQLSPHFPRRQSRHHPQRESPKHDCDLLPVSRNHTRKCYTKNNREFRRQIVCATYPGNQTNPPEPPLPPRPVTLEKVARVAAGAAAERGVVRTGPPATIA